MMPYRCNSVNAKGEDRDNAFSDPDAMKCGLGKVAKTISEFSGDRERELGLDPRTSLVLTAQ